LSGTPRTSDVGTYSNITITVSDGEASDTLGPFSIAVVATATGSATLNWLPPTMRTDGSRLTNLAGFIIYWGTSPDDLTNTATLSNPSVSTYVVDELTPGTWHFAITAFDDDGLESAFSNMASKTVAS
jgi:hypothetical protein